MGRRPRPFASQPPAPVCVALGALALGACDRDDRPAPDPDPAPAVAAAPAATRTIPIGTTFAVRVNEELTTAAHRPGDPFTATVLGPLVGPDGVELVPSGAVARGRVTAVTELGPGVQTLSLTLAFEALSFRGRSMPLQAVVEEVADRPADMAPRIAAAGVAAGTVIPVEVAAGAGRLPRGTRLTLRVTEPVQLDVRRPGQPF